MSTRAPQRRTERSLADLRSLTEALSRAAYDSGKTKEELAERCGVSRGYMSDALNTERGEVLQFQARLLVPFCEAVGILPIAYLADTLGYVLVPREHAGTAEGLALELMDVQEQVGHLSARVRRALHVGAITVPERSDIKEDARRVQREAAEVERAVDALPTVSGRRAS